MVVRHSRSAGPKAQGKRLGPGVPAGLRSWKLEDAKARFSELVRLAHELGPQRVTVHGRDAVVVLSAADYARLAPAASTSLAALFGDSPFSRLDSFEGSLVREQAPVRPAPDFAG